MTFQRTLLSALFIGLLAGLVLSSVQIFAINPIIFSAEVFELEGGHDHTSHDHGTADGEEAWAPESGVERAGYTIASNLFAGIGYAAVLLALMNQLQMQGLVRLNALKGIGWGLAGFVTCFVAPAIGLPPEIPGIEAEPVEHRQLWWLLCVLCVAVGLLTLALASLRFKALGIILPALPFIIGAPHSDGPAFLHPDAEAVASLTQLHQQFIMASGLGNLTFWLVLGLLSGWLLQRWASQHMGSGSIEGENNTGHHEGNSLGA